VEQTLKSDSQKKKEYYFQFEDGENDRVTICNEQDLLDAFECAEQEKRQSLKIFVVPGSINDTYHQAPSSSQKKETETENEMKGNEKCDAPESSSSIGCDWRKAVLEFLLDEKVKLLLPELVKRVINALHENMRNGNDVSLAEIVPNILEEKQFEDIVRHGLYQKYKHLLPMLLMHASCFTHVLLNLDEETVGTWISDIINTATVSLASDDHEMWNAHLNPWCHFANNAEGGEAIHYRVKCDGCGVAPIRGIRYKCGVCSDYDLCEKCEASQQHDPQHILLKIARPMCRRNIGPHHFVGLREVMGRRCGRWHNRASGLETEMEFPIHGFSHWRSRNPCWMKFACKNKDKMKCHKKEDKLQHRKEKLMEKLSKINSKLNGNGNDNEKKESECNAFQIKCVCGGWLAQTTPAVAYPSGQVICDRCNRNCTRDERIYHCPIERNLQHPSGYDVCLKCANDDDSKMSSCSSPESEEIQEVENNQKAENLKQEKEKEKKKEKINDPFENFQYAARARQIVEMGFSNYELIKTLLVQTKGNLEQAIAQLLSQ